MRSIGMVLFSTVMAVIAFACIIFIEWQLLINENLLIFLGVLLYIYLISVVRKKISLETICLSSDSIIITKLGKFKLNEIKEYKVRYLFNPELLIRMDDGIGISIRPNRISSTKSAIIMEEFIVKFEELYAKVKVY